MKLDELLGIKPHDPLARRARSLIDSDRRLLKELVVRRGELGLTQTEVARRMDISQSAVARIEAGARDLHQSTVRRYAMAVEARVEHRVVPDDPARQRSAKIIENFHGQMSDHSVVWAQVDCADPARTNWSSWVRLANPAVSAHV